MDSAVGGRTEIVSIDFIFGTLRSGHLVLQYTLLSLSLSLSLLLSHHHSVFLSSCMLVLLFFYSPSFSHTLTLSLFPLPSSHSMRFPLFISERLLHTRRPAHLSSSHLLSFSHPSSPVHPHLPHLPSSLNFHKYFIVFYFFPYPFLRLLHSLLQPLSLHFPLIRSLLFSASSPVLHPIHPAPPSLATCHFLLPHLFITFPSILPPLFLLHSFTLFLSPHFLLSLPCHKILQRDFCALTSL